MGRSWVRISGVILIVSGLLGACAWDEIGRMVYHTARNICDQGMDNCTVEEQ